MSKESTYTLFCATQNLQNIAAYRNCKQASKYTKTLLKESFLIEHTVPGIDLLSPALFAQLGKKLRKKCEVPSACASLTALFGMGRGVPSRQETPDTLGSISIQTREWETVRQPFRKTV